MLFLFLFFSLPPFYILSSMKEGPTKRNPSSIWINIWLHFTAPNTSSLPQRLVWSILMPLYWWVSSSCWQWGCSCPVQAGHLAWSLPQKLQTIQIHLEILALSCCYWEFADHCLLPGQDLERHLYMLAYIWPWLCHPGFPHTPPLQFIFSAPSVQVICFLPEIPLVL